MTCKSYIRWSNIINLLSLVGGIITVITGVILIPQTVTNTGDRYIGEADAYNADLQKAQIGSYGFKIVIVGLTIIGLNCIALLITCYYNDLQEHEEARIQPVPIQISVERRVRISPTVVEIPDNRVVSDKSKNIKKWLGDTIIPAHV
jgi:hypothetical protein